MKGIVHRLTLNLSRGWEINQNNQINPSFLIKEDEYGGGNDIYTYHCFL